MHLVVFVGPHFITDCHFLIRVCAGMGMHVSCVIMKDAERANPNEMHKKRTYLTFTGKAKQDQGAVMAIYQSVLKQLKEDFPHLESIIGKSDSAGCYHNEVLFA